MKSPEYLQNCVQFPDYLKPHIKDMEDLISVNESVFGLLPRIEAQKIDAETKQRALLIVTGFSGAGKDVAVNELIKRDSRFGWVRTCTTRDIRPEEIGNDPYIRLTEEQFDNALKSGDVIESNGYVGKRYCSLTSVFEKALSSYEIPVLRIDPSGTRFYSELWNKQEGIFKYVNLITVFIAPPSIDDLEARLWNRPGSNAEDVNKRLLQKDVDILYLNDAEYIAINETGKLEKMVKNIQSIIVS